MTLAIKKNSKYNSYFARNFLSVWPLLAIAIIPIWIYGEVHFYLFLGAILIIVVGLVQNESRTRYFIEEVTIKAETITVVYYKYNSRYVYSSPIYTSAVFRNPSFRTFKWRQPVLEIIDDRNHVIQYCTFGWTDKDFRDISSAQGV